MNAMKLVRVATFATAAVLAVTAAPLANTSASSVGMVTQTGSPQTRAKVKTSYYKDSNYSGSFFILQTTGAKVKLLRGSYKNERWPGDESCFIGRRSTTDPNVVIGRSATLDADGPGAFVYQSFLQLAPNGRQMGITETVNYSDGYTWTSNWAPKRVPAKKMRETLRKKWTPETGTRSPAHCLRGIARP